MATIKNGNDVYALAAFDKEAQLQPHTIGRPEPGPYDVAIDILFCGMCHSDCHACNGDWGIDSWPIAPGHEIAGVVRQVGDQVTQFKVGDKVGVGCMVSSCRECDLCQQGLEQHCPKMIQTYGSTFPEGQGDNFQNAVGYHTNGGYSSAITVNEHFVFHIPPSMKMEYAGVLLCAGITTFSPLNRHILQKGGGAGKTVGVVGFGGLGQMAVKLAKAMNVDRIVVFSRNNSKKADAEALGAELLVHSDASAMDQAARSIDLILDTVSAPHAIAPLMNTLKVGGNYVLLGAVAKPMEVGAFPLIFSRHSVEGSLIGGTQETQEMLDFCAQHQIVPQYEVIPAKDANAHFHAMIKGTSGAKRSVIDMSTIAEYCQPVTSASQ
ncbi:cinnamyl-alcohol dehydrogenase [Fistulifera solaris]|uniref:Cinnamyl-alcohol dehydrogenase n=1 Tax=Fistulifera solaris TaxID=1519565 RepID=A0A1Z5K2K3_FISSO|nr:cinnamyl-alcohol dehydrogenase [Fistulifera solaris]|eukprot:GAX20366.1 cinnamyl-alcohol dehydrogenase [Fistulifera solaris]